MSDSTINAAFSSFAHQLADKSGVAILPHFRASGEVINKGSVGFDPVTEADRGAEAVMRRMIEATYPDHGIAGEEFANRPASSPYTWVLDPIDGTRSFILGVPLWGTLIGLLHEGRPTFGMMNQPYLGERFWSASDGARFRGPGGERVIRARRCGSLGEAVLGATSPDMFKGEDLARFRSLSQACRMTRYGGDCYFYCMLAMGFLDIVAEASLQAFDIAPLIPIIAAAGGRVTSWDGGDPSQGGRILATGDASLHEAALRALQT
jgi:histidinol phosphatase-like enzyme (inositol monophosphatase family)